MSKQSEPDSLRLLAYVSDENYVALNDAALEIAAPDGTTTVLKSSPSGAFFGSIAPGTYKVVVAKGGYGTKRVTCTLGSGEPYQFRLLSNTLMGYMWPKWARSGERSEVRANSREQFQLTLWRYGLKKEYVRTLSWYDEHGPNAVMQITPDGDYSQTGVNWNNVGYLSPHIQQFIEAPERSGLYYLWARTPSGESYSFPWVVAPANPRAKIAVLANTNTWNAYNNFGGRSNYINPTTLPATPTVNARQDLARYTSATSVWASADEEYKPLAFERPDHGNHIFDNPPWDASSIEDSIQGRAQCGLAPAEWRLLGWMEREGFDYDYYAEAQLHDGSMPLNAYEVLVIGVHPEYWTREMFRRVEEWVHRGGRLMYLGGNGLNCEVVIEGDGMRCLTFDDSKEPGAIHESRMHRTYAPEARLLGVAFTDPGVMTAAPYAVLDATHWSLEGTGLKQGESFGGKSQHERVPGGASGHETDKVTPSSPKQVQLIARGENPGNGGAEMVYMDLGKGAVFSTGSITWVTSLFPDERVSRITANVLRRFLEKV
ncbi:MAG TPA: carboxypeptidase-like regulatory domain-containing protein [Edaphobacter sp.]|nr:carboxypeptidase-like regulatory domain-containing protein [Edaphobacter sp.]